MVSKIFKSILIIELILNCATFISAEAVKYKDGDHVDVYVNKVGPYWNPVIFI